MSQTDRLTHAFETGQLDPPEGTMLILRARLSQSLHALDDVIAQQSFRPEYAALQAAGIPILEDAYGSYPSALVNLTRSRDESLALVALAWDAVEPSGLLLVDGSKTDGIDAIAKTLRKFIVLDQVIPKAHGKLIVARKTSVDLPDWQTALELTPNSDGFQTSAGMFSADGIDEGSAMLARHFPNRLKGDVVDLGAGWGWLSHAALSACDKIDAIHLVEAENTALNAARLNVSDPRAQFHWADATEFTGKFDAVISNPPFHADRKPDPTLGLSFINAAARLLKPSGKLMLVANRMLPYEETLEQLFRRVEQREQSNRFKVFEATKPR